MGQNATVGQDATPGFLKIYVIFVPYYIRSMKKIVQFHLCVFTEALLADVSPQDDFFVFRVFSYKNCDVDKM